MANEETVAPVVEATPEPTTETPVETPAEGQETPPPAATEEGGETPLKPDEAEKTRTQERRERRKAHMARLREEKDTAQNELKQQNERLERAKEAAQSSVPPKETDFQDYNEYLVAVGAYHADRTIGARSAAEIEEATTAQKDRVAQIQKAQNAELAQGWADQVAEAQDIYTDFDEVVYSAPISDDVARIVAASDQGADVAYHLGKNRELAVQVSRMHPIDAAKTIGRIEAELSLPKANPVTQAPDPVSPVKGAAAVTKDPAKMSNAEYRAARKAGKL